MQKEMYNVLFRKYMFDFKRNTIKQYEGLESLAIR